MMKNKSYTRLLLLKTFEDRFEYLKIGGKIGIITFGSERYINQLLYHSLEWKQVRRTIILRDNGWDLGIKDLDIFSNPIVHHINPITADDITQKKDLVLDPDNLILTSQNTHNAIHYGTSSILFQIPIERQKGDTTPWKAY